eukprot:6597653-Pyramimonas_sp.AAC.1
MLAARDKRAPLPAPAAGCGGYDACDLLWAVDPRQPLPLGPPLGPGSGFGSSIILSPALPAPSSPGLGAGRPAPPPPP